MANSLIKKFSLIFLQAKDRYLIYILTISAFINGLYEIAIIKEFTVSTLSIQTSLYLFFAFLHIFFGIGSYLAHRFFHQLINPKKLRTLFLLLSIFILLSLFSSLKINIDFLVTPLINILFICASFTLLGMIYSLVIIYFSKTKSDYVGIIVAYSLIGLALGFLLEPFLAVHIGVNAICLILGISLIFLYINIPFFLIFILLAGGLSSYFPVDQIIEKARVKRIHTLGEIGEEIFAENFLEIFNGWSPNTKLNIYLRKDRQMIVGTHNYIPFWIYQKDIPEYTRLLYSFIRPADKVLVIGAAAGSDVKRFPSSRVTSKENTSLIEIDPLVVEYFRKGHPDYNDYIFNRVNVIIADGRTVLDEMKEKKDVIIISAFRSSITNIWMLEELKLYLFTLESFKRCFELLNDDGLLIIYHTAPLTDAISAIFKKLNIYYRVFEIVKLERRTFYVYYASKNRERIDRIAGRILASDIGTEITDFQKTPLLTDDRPFINLLGPKGRIIIRALIRYLVFIFAMMFFTLFLTGRTRGKRKMFYFFLIGNGFFLTQLFTLTRFRSFFSYPVRTLIIVNLIFLAAVSLGSILSQKIKIEYLKKKLWAHLFIVAIIFLYFYLAISNIPFYISNYFLKILAGLLIISPVGIFCGLYLPTGLVINKDRNLGLALFLDALGACSAFLLFYSICGLFGISANYYPIVFCYLLATLLISI